jgi:hypothetical protein
MTLVHITLCQMMGTSVCSKPAKYWSQPPYEYHREDEYACEAHYDQMDFEGEQLIMTEVEIVT